MRLSPGLRVGPYEVLALLGAGGMAEVYRARDTRLGRDIALKVVNEVLSADPELVHRFEQEARLAGSLNDPNLVSVYDFGSHEGSPYFVTELLEGESLRQRLARGRIPISTALGWASQMASGLAAAHGKGVIHRDVKPDNVFVTAEGQVKLLDFGIAKLAAAASPRGPHGLMDDTVTPAGGETATGAVLGTAGYMSPEQVRCEPLDPRSDLFSLGAVLYEMLSGRRAFQGVNAVESGYSILHSDPEPLPSEVPLPVAQVVRRCLEKEPARRFQSASDLAFALDVLRNPTGSATQPPLVARPGYRRARWLAVALGLGAVAALAALTILRRPEPVPPRPMALPDAEQVTFRWGTVHAARFLPDGRVVFSAAFEGLPEDIFVRPSGSSSAQSLGLTDARLLAASSTGELAVLIHPKIAMGFMADGTVARVPSVGGIPRELAEHAETADWSPKGELAIVRSEGGHVLEFPPGHPIFRTEGWISQLRFSSGGDRIAVLHHPVLDDDMGEVLVLDLTGHARTLTKRWPTSLGISWSPDGREIWFTAGTTRKNTLRAVTLDGSTREVYRSMGDIRLEDVAPDGRVLLNDLLLRSEIVYQAPGEPQQLLSWTDQNDTLAALSADGKVLFSTQQTTFTSEGLQPALVVLRGRNGSPAQVLGPGFALDLSPDGRWALVVSEDGKSLSALPTGIGQPRPIPAHGLELGLRGGRWAPDGKSVLVVARQSGSGPFHLFRLHEDGSAPTKLADAEFGSQAFLQLSRDGRWAAALTAEPQAAVVSLQDGTTHSLSLGNGELLVPRRWSREGHLWVTEGGTRSRARTRLLRLDPRNAKVLEERSIGPADPGGASPLHDVVMSDDGREIAFSYSRWLGRLYVLSGLGR